MSELLQRRYYSGNVLDRLEAAEARAHQLEAQLLTYAAGDMRYYRRGGDSGGVMPVLNVKAIFGAVGDASADDTAAIQAAADEAAAMRTADDLLRPTLYLPYSAGFVTKSPVTVAENVSVVMDGPLLYAGGANETALRIGGATRTTSATYKLRVRRSTLSNWSSEASVGIELVNLQDCYVDIIEAHSFTIGVLCLGDDGQGFAYNTIVLGRLVNNQVALDLVSDGAGWCNENLFLNGHYSVNPGVATGTARYAIRLRSIDGTYDPESNVFVKPSFELNESTNGVPVRVVNGDNNTFLYFRNESNSATVAQIRNQSRNNLFVSGREWTKRRFVLDDQSVWEDNQLLPDTTYKRMMDPATTIRVHEDWLSGAAAGAHAWTSATSGTGAAIAWGTATTAPGYLQLSTGTTATGYASIKLANFLRPQFGYSVAEWRIMLPALPDGTNDYIVQIGFGDNADIASNGCFARLQNSTAGEWQIYNIDNGTGSAGAGGVSYTAGTWVKVRVEMAADGVSALWIDDVFATIRGTNFPASSREISIKAMIRKLAGGTSRSLLVDYAYLFHQMNGRR